jgi:hypothetical protein
MEKKKVGSAVRSAPRGLPAVLGCFLLSLFGSGCGTPQDPQPPRPIVPAAITDLAAHQQGNRIVLVFTLPQKSTEGDTLAEPPEIEIYRGLASAGETSPAPQSLHLSIPTALVDTYLVEGRVRFEDPVKPEDAAAHRDQLWVYAVRTRAARRRNSEPSNVVALRVLPAPPAPLGVIVAVGETALELRWQAAPGAVSYRVYRSAMELDRSVDPPRQRPTAAALIGVSPTPSYRDVQFEFGLEYTYTVRSVAQAESDSVESDASAPVAVTPRDTFPPAPPADLVIVLVPATPETATSLELSWASGPETDVAGYHVYRSEQEGTPGARITADLLLAPAFRDMSVSPGKRYYYRVTATDRAGNESSPSAVVQEAVPLR